MFRNSGRKIMAFAKFWFWLNFVIASAAVLVAAIYLGSQKGLEPGLMAGLAGVLAEAVYLLLTWFGCLWIHSYGELVQSNCEIRELLSRPQGMPEPPQRPVYTPRTAPKAAPAAQKEDVFDWPDPEPAPQQERQSTFAYDYKASAGAPAIPVVTQPRCPKCSAKYEPGAKCCRYCGAELK